MKSLVLGKERSWTQEVLKLHEVDRMIPHLVMVLQALWRGPL